MIRFWSNRPKKKSVESGKYEDNFLLVLAVFGHFFLDPLSEKKSDPY